MRVPEKAGSFQVKAYAGTTGVLLAMNLPKGQRKNLAGFAVERKAPGGELKFLKNLLTFPGVSHTGGSRTPSDQAPFQKFRWSDYGVFPNTKYEYRIHPVYHKSGGLELKDPVGIKIKTEGLGTAGHAVIFNRAAAASQAFAREFTATDKAFSDAPKGSKGAVVLSAAAKEWLTRGLLEQLLAFIKRAKDSSFALDIAIYEYELPAIADEILAAHKRGVDVRILYHAKQGDAQTEENEKMLAKIPKAKKKPRRTSAIHHQKYIVLSDIKDGERKPKAVSTGSTNFTLNGVYYQANVLHQVNNAATAKTYLAHFEHVWDNPNDPSETRTFIGDNNPLPNDAPALFAGFSPRPAKKDLAYFAKLINGSARDVLFSTAFSMAQPIYDALLGAPHDAILRYGIQNSQNKIKGFHADRTAEFVESAMLSKGLEGFLKETLAKQKGNILVHSKVVVVDFTSDAPMVISGSHNYSNNASASNDENYVIFSGEENQSVADCYGCEVMRIYDHYRFRFRQKEDKKSGKVLELKADDSWTDRYYDGDPLATLDRLRFAGA